MAETIRRPRSAFDLRGISALAIYFALAALFFGRGLNGLIDHSMRGVLKAASPMMTGASLSPSPCCRQRCHSAV